MNIIEIIQMWTNFAENGHTEVIRALVEDKRTHGILHKSDVFGSTAAHRAAENGHVICLKLLVDAGLNVHQPDEVS